MVVGKPTIHRSRDNPCLVMPLERKVGVAESVIRKLHDIRATLEMEWVSEKRIELKKERL